MSNWFANKWFAGKFNEEWFGVVALVPAPAIKIVKRKPVGVAASLVSCGPSSFAPYCPPLDRKLIKTFASFKQVRHPEKVRALDPKTTDKRTKEHRERTKTQQLKTVRAQLHELRKDFKDVTRTLKTERAENLKILKTIKEKYTYRWAPARVFAPRLFTPPLTTQVEKVFVPVLPATPETQLVASTAVASPSPLVLAALGALPWAVGGTLAIIATGLLVPQDKKTIKFVGYGGATILFAKAVESALSILIAEKPMAGSDNIHRSSKLRIAASSRKLQKP